MKIGKIDTAQKVFIIAEIGNNHEGDFDVAIKMIQAAANSGADAVKFQTIIPEELVRPTEIERIARLKKFQFTFEQYQMLSEVAKEAGVIFFSTPFDLKGAEFLNTIQPVFKIASGDNDFLPLIEKVMGFGKPVIISSGMAETHQMKIIYEMAEKIKADFVHEPGLAFLHCVTSYPTPDEQAGLSNIKKLISAFPDVTIGYSDHTLGIKASIYAVAAGASIIEKHFTLDNQYSDFRDHQLSANPEDFKQMVEEIRALEWMFGNESEIQSCETDFLTAARRSIVLNRDFKAGESIRFEDLLWLRPGGGISPGNEHLIIGKKVNTDLLKGTTLKLSDLN
jgi:sialic acid synthase SpsE